MSLKEDEWHPSRRDPPSLIFWESQSEGCPSLKAPLSSSHFDCPQNFHLSSKVIPHTITSPYIISVPHQSSSSTWSKISIPGIKLKRPLLVWSRWLKGGGGRLVNASSTVCKSLLSSPHLSRVKLLAKSNSCTLMLWYRHWGWAT